MRALQTTSLTHKALQIPIRVCNVVKSSSGATGLSNACPDCHSSLSKPDICRGCDKEIEYGKIKKKYVIDQNDEHILTDEELEQLKNVGSDIEIIGATQKDQFKTSLIVGSYYLLPQTKLKKKSEQNKVEENKRNYAKFRAMVLEFQAQDRPVAVRFSIRQKEKLGILKVENNAVVLLTIAFSEHVNEIDEDLDIDLNDQDKQDSAKFVKSIKDTDLTQIADTYNEKLERILSGKSEPQDRDSKPKEDMWNTL